MNTMTHPTAPAVTCGANAEAFAHHPGYRRMFAADHLTLGIFLPLRFYQGDMAVLHAQAQHVSEIERLGFAAVWVRDVPLFDPAFGDAGQVFDPFVYLGYLAAHTRHIALVTGSAIFTLRHPIDLAKSAASLDRLSGGRLVMGIASGDRAVEFPAYGLAHDQRGERFAHSVDYFRQLLAQGPATLRSPLGQMSGTQLLPQPVTGRIPLIVTGSSRQSQQWLGEQADGWLTYPDATHTAQGPASPGREGSGVALADPQRRVSPAHDQRVDRPGRRPRLPAHAVARWVCAQDRAQRADRVAWRMEGSGRQSCGAGHSDGPAAG